MSFIWSFSTGGFIEGRLSCWPVEPGTLRITADDGVVSKLLTDDGDGNLVGDGSGTIDYSYGHVAFGLNAPVLSSGTEIKASYDPVEGGCVEDCGKCKTHRLRLNVSPGAITGQTQIAITDAWLRLIKKVKRDVLPSHVELLTDVFEESYRVKVGHRFDMIPGDEEPLDSAGIRAVFDDTSW